MGTSWVLPVNGEVDGLRKTSVVAYRVWLVAILAVGLALRVIFAAGISGNDDLSLANAAIGVLDHGFRIPQGHYEARFGLTAPLAAMFAAFGIGIRQLIALPIAMSLLGIFVSYCIGAHLFGRKVGLLAAATLAVFPLDVEFSGLFFPDVIQGVAMAGAVLLGLKAASSPRGGLWSIAAGICWAYAYYVKIDAFFLGFVLLLGTALGYIRWRHLLVIGVVTGILVGIELVAYGALLGRPTWHAELEHRASDEVLSATMNYRNLFGYPKAMFVTVYESGIHFYLLVAAIILAVVRRSRPALFLSGWVMIFFLWLLFGFDPFGSKYFFKPQISRYLLDFAVPMAVLIGWFLVWAYERVSRIGTVLVGGIGVTFAVMFMAFNGLSYQAAAGTRIALDRAVRENWFPLYSDLQSASVIGFLLHGSPQAADFHQVQFHDFLTGTTTFGAIGEDKGYLLINREYVERLQKRNLVTPLTPGQFGMHAQEVLTVSHPMPAVDYAVMRALAWVASYVPLAPLREKVLGTATDVLEPDTVTVYQLDR